MGLEQVTYSLVLLVCAWVGGADFTLELYIVHK